MSSESQNSREPTEQEIAAAAKRMLGELAEQAEGGASSPYIYDDDDLRRTGIDGRVDLLQLAAAALKGHRP